MIGLCNTSYCSLRRAVCSSRLLTWYGSRLAIRNVSRSSLVYAVPLFSSGWLKIIWPDSVVSTVDGVPGLSPYVCVFIRLEGWIGLSLMGDFTVELMKRRNNKWWRKRMKKSKMKSLFRRALTPFYPFWSSTIKLRQALANDPAALDHPQRGIPESWRRRYRRCACLYSQWHGRCVWCTPDIIFRSTVAATSNATETLSGPYFFYQLKKRYRLLIRQR